MTGIIWACVATLLAACAPILAKAGTKKTDPALSGSIAGIVLCVVIFFYAKPQILAESSGLLGQKSIIFVLLAGLATGLFGICFFKALHEGVTSGVVTIVRCSYVITLVAGVFIFHSSMSVKDYIVIALMIAGAVVLNLDEKKAAFSLLASVCAAGAVILIKYSGVQTDRSIIAFWCVFIGAVVLVIYTIAQGGTRKIKSMSFVDGICLILAGIAFPVSHDFYNRALGMAGGIVTYIFNMVLLVMMICSAVILKEKISGKKLIGAALFILALFVMQQTTFFGI